MDLKECCQVYSSYSWEVGLSKVFGFIIIKMVRTLWCFPEKPFSNFSYKSVKLLLSLGTEGNLTCLVMMNYFFDVNILEGSSCCFQIISNVVSVYIFGFILQHMTS